MHYKLGGFEHDRLQCELALVGLVQTVLDVGDGKRLLLAGGLEAVVTPAFFDDRQTRQAEMVRAGKQRLLRIAPADLLGGNFKNRSVYAVANGKVRLRGGVGSFEQCLGFGDGRALFQDLTEDEGQRHTKRIKAA